MEPIYRALVMAILVLNVHVTAFADENTGEAGSDSEPTPIGPLDLNNDGVLTSDEFEDSDRGRRKYQLWDTNNDGIVTRDEVEAIKIAFRTNGRRETTDATAALDPKKVLLFVAGLCDFEGENHFAQEDRMDGQLVRWFRNHGTPSDRIIYLRDAEATAANMKRQFERLLAKSQAGDQLVVYISTHGGREDGRHFFCAYDGYSYSNRANTWDFEKFFETIDVHFKGESAFVFGDCCHAGALTQEATIRSTGRISYFAMGASMASHSAPGAWTFCQAIVAGLRGSPYLDMDGDGNISLGELMHFTNSEMAFTDDALPVAKVTGGFTWETILSKRVGDLYQGKVGRRALLIGQGRPLPRVHIVDDAGENVLIQDIGIGRSGRFGVPLRRWVPLESTRPWTPKRVFDVDEKVVVRKWNFAREEYGWVPATVGDLFRLGVYGVLLEADYDDDGQLQHLDGPTPDLAGRPSIRRRKK